MNLGTIGSIGSISGLGRAELANLSVNNTNNDKKSFSKLLEKSIQEVNEEQVEGYNAMEGIATGKVQNLQEAVRQIEEAELSLKLALEVKNKALSAYKEIMKMQV